MAGEKKDVCPCVEWLLVAAVAAEALEHNAGVSDYAGTLHDELKKLLTTEQLEDLEFRHHLLQGYVTENMANMALAGSIGSIEGKCNVDVTNLKNLAHEGFDAIKERAPSTAANRFMRVKGELLSLAQEVCGLPKR